MQRWPSVCCGGGRRVFFRAPKARATGCVRVSPSLWSIESRLSSSERQTPHTHRPAERADDPRWRVMCFACLLCVCPNVRSIPSRGRAMTHTHECGCAGRDGCGWHGMAGVCLRMQCCHSPFSILCCQGRGCPVRQSISALACAFSVSTWTEDGIIDTLLNPLVPAAVMVSTEADTGENGWMDMDEGEREEGWRGGLRWK